MITQEILSLPPMDRREVFRYTGAIRPSAAEEALLSECAALADPVIEPRVCWEIFPAQKTKVGWDLGFTETDSGSVAMRLGACDRVLVFAATVGIGIDRLIARELATGHAARAVMLQAIGTERVEALCDRFCDEMHRRGYPFDGRFSPGYGDLPLAVQKEIFRALDCPRKIGLTLNDSLLMSPSKSVTALAGIYKVSTEDL